METDKDIINICDSANNACEKRKYIAQAHFKQIEH